MEEGVLSQQSSRGPAGQVTAPTSLTAVGLPALSIPQVRLSCPWQQWLHWDSCLLLARAWYACLVQHSGELPHRGHNISY